MATTSNNCVDFFKSYLQKHPNQIHETNDEGNNMLMSTCDPDIFFRHDETTSMTFVHAIDSDRYAVIKILIDAGSDVSKTNNNGETALILACKDDTDNSNYNIIKLLLEKNSNVNHQDNNKNTALIYACQYQIDIQIIELLIKYGANVNIQNKTGFTAIMLAKDVYGGMYNYNIVSLLIKHGADINIANLEGDTLLMLACLPSMTETNSWLHNTCPLRFQRNTKYYVEIMELLIDNSADLELVNNHNQTCIMLFLKNVKIDANITDFLLRLIIASSNVLQMIDNDNNTAYDYYRRQNVDILDDYYLSILKTDTELNRVKSATFIKN